ncbi:hypothetical protein [Prosthecobacter fusiformis]|nr:hypothetical protein [Prosthecobacter fusiformis]
MESFTVMLFSNAPQDAILDFFHGREFVGADASRFWMEGTFIERVTSEFIVEGLIQKRDKHFSVSLRFALSNPDTVDAYMKTLILDFFDQWRTQVIFMSGTRKDLDFSPKDKDALLQALDEQIPILRHLWQSRTGQYKTAPLRASEAYKFTGLVD